MYVCVFGYTYLVADVNFHSAFQVVEDLFQVPGPGSTQIAGIAVRLERAHRKVKGHTLVTINYTCIYTQQNFD